MYNEYKVKVCVPSGRRHLMKLLIPYLLMEQDVIDEIILWENTKKSEDYAFLEELANKYEIISVFHLPENVERGLRTIDKFYDYCWDDDTIYIKIDDDVIFLEEGVVKLTCQKRLEYKDALLVSPLVINNAMSGKMLHIDKGFQVFPFLWTYDSVFTSPEMGEKTHNFFIDNYNKGLLQNIYCNDLTTTTGLMNIHFIAWFGKDFRGFEMPWDETFMTQHLPLVVHKNNVMFGNGIVCHYTFSGQDEYIRNNTDIYEKYKNILLNKCKNNEDLNKYCKEVFSIVDKIDKKNGKTAICIPSHKEHLEDFEKQSLEQCVKVLGSNYDIYLIVPDNISLDEYEVTKNNLKVKSYPPEYFSNVGNHNLYIQNNKEYYQSFKDLEYEWILNYELDAYIFYDAIDYFINTGYEYFGAPWSEANCGWNNNISICGNSGFSLRNIDAMIRGISFSFSDKTLPCDVFFCIHNHIVNVCPSEIGSLFSIEQEPDDFLNRNNGKIPMGIHRNIEKRESWTKIANTQRDDS